MSCFRTIVVAADFSDSSREAFRVACSLAHADETRLVVLHIAAPPIIYSELDIPIPVPGEDQARCDELSGHLRKVYVPDRPLRVEYCTRSGLAVEDILRVSAELGADLIILGTHGRTGVRRLLTGSVAEAVLRRAHCPVLALRSPAHLDAMPAASEETRQTSEGVSSTEETARPEASQSGVSTARSPRTILHPTDFSEPSEAAFRVACSLSREHGARLIVLHVTPMASVYGGTFPGVPADPEVYRHALEERLRQIQIPGPEADAGPGPEDSGTPESKVLVEHRLREGDTAMEITRAADDVGADLIVMGTHGRTGLGRMLMGSVAENVLRRANRPVLMLKPPHSEPKPVSNEPHPRPVILL